MYPDWLSIMLQLSLPCSPGNKISIQWMDEQNRIRRRNTECRNWPEILPLSSSCRWTARCPTDGRFSPLTASLSRSPAQTDSPGQSPSRRIWSLRTPCKSTLMLLECVNEKCLQIYINAVWMCQRKVSKKKSLRRMNLDEVILQRLLGWSCHMW